MHNRVLLHLLGLQHGLHKKPISCFGLSEDKYSQSEMYSPRNTQPMQVTEKINDMIILPRVTDMAHSCIENGLESVQQVADNTRQNGDAVVSDQ